MAAYNMTNIRIEEALICSGTVKTVLIYADSERFGENEIMAQLPTMRAALEWLQNNGVDLHELALEWLQNEIDTTGGRVQVANTMFRRIYRDNSGSLWGYSNGSGWCVLDKYFAAAVVCGAGRAKTSFSEWYGPAGATVKFGNACTW